MKPFFDELLDTQYNDVPATIRLNRIARSIRFPNGDNGNRVLEAARVADVLAKICRSYDPPHHLCVPGLREHGDETNRPRFERPPQLVDDQLHQLVPELFVALRARL